MAQSVLSVRMDEQLKQEFDAICEELGMSMSTAVTMLAKKMSREKRLPFEVSVDPFFSVSNTDTLRESMQQMAEGKTVVKSLRELEEMENG